MDSFQWGEHFVTGLEEVDKQHHHLVDQINKLASQMTKDVIPLEDVDILYGELAEYAVYHFQEEEQLNKDMNVDPRHLNHHIESHNSFIEDVKSIYSRISMENSDQAHSFMKFLTHWLVYHILGEDQDMANQIRAIESGMSPSNAFNKFEKERDSATAPLLEALNGLFDLVTIRNKELKQLNESLEEKVKARTKELSEANRKLEELSLTDVLTGLPNRRHAINSLSDYWNKAVQKGIPLACMMVDADHFKEVNDFYGHDAGDKVLMELAQTLKHSLRNDDIVCRLGGDEFFVICPNTEKEGGFHVAELTRKNISELKVSVADGFWSGSVSIGIAFRTPHMLNYQDLIKEADEGVYAAKEAGKNCVRTALK